MCAQIRNLQDVVDWGLCTGCGACYTACRKGGIELVNVESMGIRPRFKLAECASCTECLSICPGYSVEARLRTGPVSPVTEAEREFGPAVEIWEGYAADQEIRYKASSGGLLSALSLFCLEREDVEFVLHTGMDDTKPWLNCTVQSRTREDLLRWTGSRYAPASPCDSLNAIEKSARPCVFIGKPCDVAAVAALRKQRPALDRNLGLVLTFFCAGTPSTQGTLRLIDSLHVSTGEIKSVRYRGEGWPGRFKVKHGTGNSEASYSYEQSWGRLTGFRPLRCHLCPDGLGQLADLSCGDAWEQLDSNGDAGRSIVLVRTERGRQILHRAIAAGYVKLDPVGSDAVLRAQPNLLGRRRDLFGRLTALRILGIPVPKFEGFSLFYSWIRLPLTKKFRTVAGTLRRAITRHLYKRQRIDEPTTTLPWDRVGEPGRPANPRP